MSCRRRRDSRETCHTICISSVGSHFRSTCPDSQHFRIFLYTGAQGLGSTDSRMMLRQSWDLTKPTYLTMLSWCRFLSRSISACHIIPSATSALSTTISDL